MGVGRGRGGEGEGERGERGEGEGREGRGGGGWERVRMVRGWKRWEGERASDTKRGQFVFLLHKSIALGGKKFRVLLSKLPQ